MSEELQGIKVSGDVQGLIKAMRDGKVSVKDFTSFLEGEVAKKLSAGERGWNNYQKAINNVARELKGNGATAQLNILQAAVDQVGGSSKLTAIQLENVVAKVKSLEKAGGTAPAQLKQLATEFDRVQDAAKKVNLKDIVTSEATQKVTGMTSQLGPLGGVLTALGPAGLAAGAGLAVAAGTLGGLASAAKDAMNFGAHVTDVAAATRMTTTEVQQLEHAARVSGTGIDVATDAVTNMQKQLVEAPEKFEKLGLSVEHLRSIPITQAMAETGDALENVTDAETRTTAANDIFKKSWGELAGLLTGGMDAMAGATVLTDDQIRSLNDAKTAANLAEAEWDRLWTRLGTAVVEGGDVAGAIGMVTKAITATGEAAEKYGPGIWWILSRLATMPALGGMAVWKDLPALFSGGDDELGGKVKSKLPKGVAENFNPWSNNGGTTASPESKKALADAEAEYAQAIAKSLPPLQAQVAAIHAATDAQIAKAKESLKKPEDAEVLKQTIQVYRDTEKQLVANVQAQHALEEAEKHHALAIANKNEAYKASHTLAEMVEQSENDLAKAEAASLSPLDQKVLAIWEKAEASADAAFAEWEVAKATGESTQADLENRDAAIANAIATAEKAEATLRAANARELLAASTAVVNESEKALAAALEAGDKSLRAQLASIEATRKAQIDKIQADLDAKKITAEAAAEAIDNYNRVADAAVRSAASQSKAFKDMVGAISTALGSVKDLMDVFGVSGDTAFGKVVDGASKAVSAIQSVIAVIESINSVIDTINNLATALGGVAGGGGAGGKGGGILGLLGLGKAAAGAVGIGGAAAGAGGAAAAGGGAFFTALPAGAGVLAPGGGATAAGGAAAAGGGAGLGALASLGLGAAGGAAFLLGIKALFGKSIHTAEGDEARTAAGLDQNQLLSEPFRGIQGGGFGPAGTTTPTGTAGSAYAKTAATDPATVELQATLDMLKAQFVELQPELSQSTEGLAKLKDMAAEIDAVESQLGQGPSAGALADAMGALGPETLDPAVDALSGTSDTIELLQGQFVALQPELEQSAAGLARLAAMAAEIANLQAAEGAAPPPSYDIGTTYVPRTGLALLHQGEAVLPAAVNPFVGGRAGALGSGISVAVGGISVNVTGADDPKAVADAVTNQIVNDLAPELESAIHMVVDRMRRS